MNIRKAIYSSLTVLTLAASLVLGTANKASAIPYEDIDTDAPQSAVFNVYTGVPAGVGNEADFVRLRRSTGNPQVPAPQAPYSDPVNTTCEEGDMFDVRTYVHNGADEDSNDNGEGPGVAHNTRVTMNAPLGVEDDKFVFTSTISASNADSVTDTGTLNCGDDVELELVPSTVFAYSTPYGWVQLPDGAVGHSDIYGNATIGSPVAGSGDVWGCFGYRVWVVYTVRVVEAETPPPPPEQPPTPEQPEVTKLPDTGAGDLVAIFVATTFAGMVAYRVVLARKYQ